MITAVARVALDAVVDEPHLRDLSDHTIVDIVGTGPDWRSAQAAVVVPEGGLVLYWIRG